jgi:CSLREA domain-containing protein
MRFALILITLVVCLSPVLAQNRKPLTVVSNTFVVNNTGDANDNSAGDGSCATSTSVCTLRAAIQEANAVAGADTITFSISGVINLFVASSEDGESALTISRDVIINGPGANLLTVRPNSGFRVRVLNVLGECQRPFQA